MESDTLLGLRLKMQHVFKYEVLVAAMGGRNAFRHRVPLIPLIQCALKDGDEHLNTISLHQWDRYAGLKDDCGKEGESNTWPQLHKQDWPIGLSLAERVCVLKHAAVMLANDGV